MRSLAEQYTEAHVRALSVVAAKLASYFTMLRAGVELAQLTRQRDEARRAAETANRAKGEVLSLVSDQLGRPLGSIVACAQLLRSTGTDAAAAAGAIDEIERSVEMQFKLIDHLRNVVGGGSADRPFNLGTTLSGSRTVDQSTQGRSLSGIHVLLVDHDLDICESFKSVLDEHGAEVTTTISAPAALAAFERSRPDVLLIGDLAVHGGNAYDLIREVTARTSPLPIVSISAWRLDETDRAPSAAIRLHLIKPLEIRTLVDTVAQVAGRTLGKVPRTAAIPK